MPAVEVRKYPVTPSSSAPTPTQPLQMYSWKTSMTPSSAPPTIEPGDTVCTPTGRRAEVLAVFPNDQEALVMWCDKQSARFRLKLLTKVTA